MFDFGKILPFGVPTQGRFPWQAENVFHFVGPEHFEQRSRTVHFFFLPVQPEILSSAEDNGFFSSAFLQPLLKYSFASSIV
jgi:hypothetical protein